ncbi:toxin secretion/phage lysis holin [Bifidobacterium pseudolongum subsp. globosum]|uniref:Toxin secretion/phage lysis holin n=1 Tax=Bifidobacterium pseudolongum subsp. globosum TaxID=1690 RepID=A0A4Q5BB08_9BIFI|nr:phage holin family protein [Bifidobacterium pseudolongum]RYQ66084.1 toxin secretion/phage lysis holin [Bifidobacterium pseudolongum subsp. globosum]
MTNLHVIGITSIFMVLDIITGFIKAWKDNDVKSKALRAGLFHKASFILVIVLAQAVEYAADEIPQIQLNVPIVGAICAYIILTEVVSVLENLKAMNPAIGGIMNKFPAHPDDPSKPDKE